jgi:hypothetical protein
MEATEKSIEVKLLGKKREIQTLKERKSNNTDAISVLSDKLNELVKEMEILKHNRNFGSIYFNMK